ncbi:unnamed protein product [Dovyalis caffra]|uniref:MLO-like protein n=1 Tax=Dovyalis caffra TaxID=77055 RepID=A0AAV1SW38_9ROSI|nr:unnamed protein product [Dovyalis caffra]
MENEDVLIRQGRSLAETPTYSVASVITVLWLEKTRRKALVVSLEKIKEELMLLGLISLFLAQCARWISEICVNSSLFSSKFYLCSEGDYGNIQNVMLENSSPFLNETHNPPKEQLLQQLLINVGREPFVSLEGLEQLHRFLFVLGITHVLYSCLAVGLAMSKIYSWKKWENQTSLVADGNLQGKQLELLKHKLPISYNFHKYMVRSMEDEFHGILGISSLQTDYIADIVQPCLLMSQLVMLVGTKLQHVVSTLALEIGKQTGPSIGNQMGSRCKKALVAESVRESLHSWCKRVKERSKRDSATLSVATRSVCSLDTTIDEHDEITVASGTLSRSSSLGSLNEITVVPPHEQEVAEDIAETSNPRHLHHQLSLRIEEYLNDSTSLPPPIIDEEDDLGNAEETLFELFQRT